MAASPGPKRFGVGRMSPSASPHFLPVNKGNPDQFPAAFVLEEFPFPVASWVVERGDASASEKSSPARRRSEKVSRRNSSPSPSRLRSNPGEAAERQKWSAEQLRQRQQAHLNRIPGEIADADGDFAVSFIELDRPCTAREASGREAADERPDVWEIPGHQADASINMAHQDGASGARGVAGRRFLRSNKDDSSGARRGFMSPGCRHRRNRSRVEAAEIISLSSDDEDDKPTDMHCNAGPRKDSPQKRATESSAARSGLGAPPNLSSLTRPAGPGAPQHAAGEASPLRHDGHFFCLLCHNTVSEDLAMAMPTCECRFCLFCLQPAIHSQVTAASELISEKLMDDVAAMQEGVTATPSAPGVGGIAPATGAASSAAGTSSRGSALQKNSILCPGCSLPVDIPLVKDLAPDAFQLWEGSIKSAQLITSQPLLACPKCGLRTLREASSPPPGLARTGVPELDRTAPKVQETDDAGQPLSVAAAHHKAQHRFRCPQCDTIYCGGCRCFPYHLGRTCEEQAVWESLPTCRFCDERVEGLQGEGGDEDGDSKDGPETHGRVLRSHRRARASSKSSGQGRRPSRRELKREVEAMGADTWWCVETRDLEAVLLAARRVCAEEGCQEKLKLSCTRSHERCGHPCGGVRGEAPCLPCLHEDCLEKAVHSCTSSSVAPAVPGPPLPCEDDLCAICWVEAIGKSPALLLKCGHVVHASCAKEKVQARYPGPELSFAFLNCPVCPSTMSHPFLDQCMQAPRALKAKVDALLERKHDAENPPKLQPAVKFGPFVFGKAGPSDEEREARQAALQDMARRSLFFECVRCQEPYYGGDRACGAAAGGPGPAAAADGGDGDAGAERGERGAGARRGRRRSNRGGQQQGAAGAEDDAEAARNKKKDELVCPDCVAAEFRKKMEQQKGAGGMPQAGEWKGGALPVCLKGHGSGYIQFKCRFCCAPASYFCFGSTHFCTKCHNVRPDFRGHPQPPACTGGKDCPLGLMNHPPHGQEYCLGCALCRIENEKEKHAQ